MTIGRGTGKGLIDQAFFGFNSQDGLTIVASSLSSNDEELKWRARLRQHLRLQAHPETPLPSHALSYFLFAESAAVLRRVPGGDSGGRNNSHVLIGPARVLTARVALGLELWPGWQSDPPADRKMTRLDPRELDWGVDPGDELRSRAHEKAGDLERVLSWLLEKPGRPLSIIGCPADERVALLWGLMEIGAPLLQDQGIHRDWTFSTHETEHSDAIQYLPETVCLPARPVGTSAADRTSVDLTRSGSAGPRAAEQAHQLVERYLRAQSGPLEHDQPAATERARPVPADSASVQSGSAQVRPPAAVPASAPPAADPGSPSDDLTTMVRRLLAAENRGDFEGRLTRVEEHTGSAFDRHRIRMELNNNGYATALIDRLLPSTDRELTFKRILLLAFGSELTDFRTKTVRQEAELLIEKSPSDDFVSALLKTATMHNWYEQIAPSVERRRPGQWTPTELDQTAQSRPERTALPDLGKGFAEPQQLRAAQSPGRSTSAPGRSTSAPGRSTSAKSLNKYKKLIAVAWISSLALASAFVLVMFTNSADPDPAVTASPVPTTSDPAPGTSDPAPMAPNAETEDLRKVSATVQEKDENGRITLLNATPQERLREGEQLWLFVRRGDGTLFPQPAPCALEGETWKCKQVHTNLPDDANNDYEVVFFIVDQQAADSLIDYEKKRQPKDTLGNGMKINEIPPAATETDLILLVS